VNAFNTAADDQNQGLVRQSLTAKIINTPFGERQSFGHGKRDHEAAHADLSGRWVNLVFLDLHALPFIKLSL
jgi:hypothetical protein